MGWCSSHLRWPAGLGHLEHAPAEGFRHVTTGIKGRLAVESRTSTSPVVLLLYAGIRASSC